MFVFLGSESDIARDRGMSSGRTASLRCVAAGASVLVASLVLLVSRNSVHPGSDELLSEQLWYNAQHEVQEHVPIRSVDTFGGYLPSFSKEMRTPGFFEQESDDVAKYSKPLKLAGEASIREEPSSMAAMQQAAAAEAPAPAPAALQQTPDSSVPVHVVDTPEGRMIYYPYVPNPGSVPTAQAGLEANQGGASSSLTSAAAAPGGSVVGKVLQETDGTWTAPYGDYNAIQGNLPAAQKQQQELSHVERQLMEYKKAARRKIERVKGKVWRDHKRYLEMHRELDRLRVQVG